MADPQSVGPPGSPSVPAWAPPVARPATLPPPPPPPPPPLHGHQQHLMASPPFSVFPHGNPGFVHGFPSPLQHPQQHYYNYNVGPRPFPPFHGLAPNQGSFGSPPPLAPPPRAPPPHMISGMVSSFQSPRGGGAGQLVSGNAAQSEQYNTTPAHGIAKCDNLGFSKEDEEINVIEKALQQSQEEKNVDMKALLSQIRAIVDQAEEAVQKVGKLVMLEPSMSESRFVTCPYDPSHRVPPEDLFKHYLCCPSNPKPQKVDPQKLISSLQYPHSQQHDDDEDSGPENQDSKTSQVGDGLNPNSSVSCRANLPEGGMQVEKGDTKSDQLSILRSGAPKGDAAKAFLGNEIDIWGGRFFYMDSPAVFQAPLPTPHPAAEVPWSHSVDKLGAKLESTDNVGEPISSISEFGCLASNEEMCGGDGVVGPPLLASRFWFLQREIQQWKKLPTRCSTLALQAASEVGRVRGREVSEWVLVQGPAHGVVTDSALANHIHSLARICLRALQKEAAFNLSGNQCDDLLKHSIRSPSVSEEDNSHGPKAKVGQNLVASGGTDDQKRFHEEFDTEGGLTKVEEPPTSVVVGGDAIRGSKVSLLDFPQLFHSGQWLASQLSSLFGPLQSKALVLKLFKYCLVLSGRILASSFVTTFTKQQKQLATTEGLQLCRSVRNKGRDVKPSEELQTHEDSKHLKPKDGNTVEDISITLPLEVETAVAAVRERAILESYLRSLNYPSVASNLQMAKEHEETVTMATTERRKRVNYRPVLEHDGLIWNRFQLEEKNKNKTREEILAEERDYKRRRMSYRGKKLKRNPTEVLHDLIGGHMEEIVEAGGIGCSVRHNTGAALPPLEASGFDSGSQPRKSDDRSNEQIRPSRPFQQDFTYRTGPTSQGSRYSEIEDGGNRDDHREGGNQHKSDGSSRGKLHNHSSYPSSDSVKDNQSFLSRSGSGRDDSRSDWPDNRMGNSEKDHRRDRSHSQSQRHISSREGSNEGDGYERGHSREYRGKSKSNY